jgi:hypothetical protein
MHVSFWPARQRARVHLPTMAIDLTILFLLYASPHFSIASSSTACAHTCVNAACFATLVSTSSPAPTPRLGGGQIDWGKGEDFLEVLRGSAYASTGPTHKDQRFEAEVVSKDESGVTVDYGGKFNARVRMSSRQ